MRALGDNVTGFAPMLPLARFAEGALEEMDDPERAFQQIGWTPTRKSEKSCWPSRISFERARTVRSFGRHPLPSQRHRRYWQ